MRKLTLFCQKSLALLILLTATAQAAVTDAQAQQLLEKSGLSQSIASLPQQMTMMSQQMGQANTPEEKAFMQLLADSFDVEVTLQIMRNYVKANASESDLATVINKLDTPLAKKFIAAELKTTSVEHQHGMMQFIANLQSNPPSEARQQAIVNFVTATQLAEKTQSMVMSMLKSMFEAIKARDNDAKKSAMLDEQLAQLETILASSFEQQMILTSLYTYRDISNEELKEYANFFQQDSGKTYLSLIFGAIEKGMSEWGVTLVNLVKKNRNQ